MGAVRVSTASTDTTKRAPSRLTAMVLDAGSLVSAAFFLVGVVLETVGRTGGESDPLDPGAIVAAVSGLQAWGWSTLGVAALIATPALGLVATALEYRSFERRSSLLALLVLGVLAASLAVALVR
jgi:uncharacterized membrane protein